MKVPLTSVMYFWRIKMTIQMRLTQFLNKCPQDTITSSLCRQSLDFIHLSPSAARYQAARAKAASGLIAIGKRPIKLVLRQPRHDWRNWYDSSPLKKIYVIIKTLIYTIYSTFPPQLLFLGLSHFRNAIFIILGWCLGWSTSPCFIH